MAPRRLMKRMAETATDGNVMPPKKRSTAVKSAVAMDEPRQTKSRSRQARADKQEKEVAGGPVSPPKKSRGKQKNAAGTTAVATVDITRSRPKRQVNRKPKEDATVEKDHVVAEKKTRSGKMAAAKKAATTPAATRSKTKALTTSRKQKTEATDDAGDSRKRSTADEVPAKRTTRRMKATEEGDAPAQPTIRVSRKRKNVESTDKIIAEMQIILEAEEENEAKVTVAGKKSRRKAKQTESDDAPTTSKGRSKKNPVKEVAKSPREEDKNKKQNAVQENNSKTKNVKNTKKANAKKAAPKKKLDVAVEKTDEAQAEEAEKSEMDMPENEEAQVTELNKKKRNAGKMNAAMNGKVEAKKKQKKEQATAASVDEKEATENETEENEIIELDAIKLKIKDENDTTNVSSSTNDEVLLLQNDETSNTNKSNTESVKDESNLEETINEMESSGEFLGF